MTILDQIADERRRDIEQAKAVLPERALIDAAHARKHHSLIAALKAHSGKCVIAEIKKASPSAGVITKDFDPCAIAAQYIKAGAGGLSILTEHRHFLGSEDHLKAVRKLTELPILRKDFIVDPYQVTEAAAWGADVILIIVAMLDRGTIQAVYDKALTLGLEVIAESHDAEELEMAAALPRAILGINNRNLKTLRTTLDTSRKLAGLIPAGRVSISESGISSQTQIDELAAMGYNGFLIGESILKGKFSIGL
jgi:indole-3-glycerol phosphate synthase